MADNKDKIDVRFPPSTSAEKFLEWISFTRQPSTNTCPTVRALLLRGCQKLTDATLVELLRVCNNLRMLDISSCPLLTDDAFLSLKNATCDSLNELDLSYSGDKITHVGIDRIAKRFKMLYTFKLNHFQEQIQRKDLTPIIPSTVQHLYLAHLPSSVELDKIFFNSIAKKCASLKTLDLSSSTVVLEYVELQDMASIGQVCSAWRRRVFAAKKLLTTVDFRKNASGEYSMDDYAFSDNYWRRFSRYRRRWAHPFRNPKWSNITDGMLSIVVSDCPSLKRIYLSNCDQITDSGVSLVLDCCKNLEDIDIRYCTKISSRCFIRIKRRLENVKRVDVRGCNVTEAFLQRMKAVFPNLEFVGLRNNQNKFSLSILKEALTSWGESLTEIAIENFPCTTDLLYELHTICPKLTSLFVIPQNYRCWGYDVSTTATNFPNLKRFSVDWLNFNKNALNELLTKCTRLQVVEIHDNSEIDFGSVKAVLGADLPDLRVVSIRINTEQSAVANPEAGAESTYTFPLHKNLHTVSLIGWSTSITDEFALALFASAPRLKSLRLIPPIQRYSFLNNPNEHKKTMITDKSIEALVQGNIDICNSLTSVDLSYSGITDNGVKQLLQACKFLNKITLTGCANLSLDVFDASSPMGIASRASA